MTSHRKLLWEGKINRQDAMNAKEGKRMAKMSRGDGKN
jgi:hypothetical protein